MAEIPLRNGFDPTNSDKMDDINRSISLQRNDVNEDPRLEMEMSDSPDEYSSGSDRSYDAEDGESPEDTTSKSKKCSSRMQRLGSHGSRRHKGGNRHKKIFQPYPAPDETNLKRKSIERKEKETAAAEVRKEVSQDFMKFPIAPFNSTQFLMDEQNSSSPPASVPKTPNHTSISSPSDEVIAEDCNRELSQVDKKDFADVYTSVHAEGLQSLSKAELVKHYMGLEEKIALLQKEVKQRTESKESSKEFSDINVLRKQAKSVDDASGSGNFKISVSS